MTELVTAVLPPPGEELPAGPGESVTACWQWLTRTWDPQAPARSDLLLAHPGGSTVDVAFPGAPELRWGGMSREIGAGLPDPAVEVCVHWAADVVAAAIVAEEWGYATHQRVRAARGEFAGQAGYVQDVVWEDDDDAQRATGPVAYAASLDNADADDDVWIETEDLEPVADYRWPHRPPCCGRARPQHSLPGPRTPQPSCAEDLESLLARAANPGTLPEDLRERIRGGWRRHHLADRYLARPRPDRVTAQLVCHWYQLTEHYQDEPSSRATVWEVVITRHLRDETAVHLVATSRQEAADLCEQRTGLAL